jgi:group I intron endonuclease
MVVPISARFSDLVLVPTGLGSGVYKITCIIEDKFYLGGTRNIRARWKEHLNALRRNRHSSPKLQQAFNAHGEGSFLLSVVELCPRLDLKNKEQFYLDLWKPYRCGYNLLPSAHSLQGTKWSKEHRDRQRQSMIGNTLSLGRKHTKETLIEIAESNSRRIISQQTRLKMRLNKLGKPLSTAHKLKLSAALKGRKPVAAIAASSVNKPGTAKSLEQRVKISNTLKNYYAKNPPNGCCALSGGMRSSQT